MRTGRLAPLLILPLVAAGALISLNARGVFADAAPDSAALRGDTAGAPDETAGVPHGTTADPRRTAAARHDTATTPHRLIAYYFHTNYRCASCRKIEAYTREAIEGGFAREIKDGRLVFQLMNLDEKQNKHFIKDYKLFTKSVVLVEERKGSPPRWKNLPKIWELLNDKAEFVSYVQEETRAWLSKASETP